jgi:hypothetical protein
MNTIEERLSLIEANLGIDQATVQATVQATPL